MKPRVFLGARIGRGAFHPNLIPRRPMICNLLPLSLQGPQEVTRERGRAEVPADGPLMAASETASRLSVFFPRMPCICDSTLTREDQLNEMSIHAYAVHYQDP